MAQARIRSKGTGFTIDVEVTVGHTERALRDVRRQIGRDFDEIQRKAGEKAVLPEAKRRAGGLRVDGSSVAGSLVVRRRRTAPFLTTTLRGRKGRAVGLLEHGGTVRTVIRPRRRQAVVVNGQPVALVRTAREYRARRFMQSAVGARLGAFGDQVREDLVDVFALKGFEVT